MVGASGSQVAAPSQVVEPRQVDEPIQVAVWQVSVPGHEGYSAQVGFGEHVASDPAQVGSAVQVIGLHVSKAAHVAFKHV
jgi:hypothetical protein